MPRRHWEGRNIIGQIQSTSMVLLPDIATVEVWQASLDIVPEHLRELSKCLTRDEHARAGRLRFAQHRVRFVAARALLRNILAGYLNVAPELVRFGYGLQGKPFLLNYPDLQFNLSHAGNLLVIGVVEHRRLGIDIEPVPTDDVIDSVSGLVFSAPERRALQRLASAHRRDFFAQLWTRKEAYIKADGQGMSIQLDHVDASTVPNRILLLDDACDQWVASSHWFLDSLPVDCGFAGAVAVEGPYQLICQQFHIVD